MNAGMTSNYIVLRQAKPSISNTIIQYYFVRLTSDKKDSLLIGKVKARWCNGWATWLLGSKCGLRGLRLRY